MNYLEKLLFPFGFSLGQNNWLTFSPDIWYAKFFFDDVMKALALLSWMVTTVRRAGQDTELTFPPQL